MSKVLLDVPFKVEQKKINFWNFMYILFTKYDVLEDSILGKFIEEWEKSVDLNNKKFKTFLRKKINENSN
jgi:hypothetical protein